MASEADRAGSRCRHQPAHKLGCRNRRGAGCHHEKLVAPVASEDVTGPQLPPQPLGSLGQHLVSALVAVAVVQLFEAVEVKHDHGARLAAALSVVARLSEALEAVLPASSLGEGIGAHGLLQLSMQV